MLVIKNQEYFDKVCAWANENNLMGEFLRTLCYLDDYGCIQGEKGFMQSRDKDNIKCLLFPDQMEHSFYFEMYKRLPVDPRTFSEYSTVWMNGGMIYFESDKTWSIHT